MLFVSVTVIINHTFSMISTVSIQIQIEVCPLSSVKINNLNVKASGQGDFLILSGKMCKRPFVLGVVYGHSSSSDRKSLHTITKFFQTYDNICSTLDNPQMNVTGDFNFVLHDSDFTSKAHYSRKPLTEAFFSNSISKLSIIRISEQTSKYVLHSYF